MNTAAPIKDHRALRFLTAGSVDDGKSTLIGRLLLDTLFQALPQLVDFVTQALVVEGDNVTGVTLADGSTISADTVVVATGAWTAPFLAPYGIDVPIKVHREQIVMIDPGVELGAVPVFSDLVSLQYVRPGPRIGDDVEILAGLKPGDRVALDPVAAAARVAGARP